MELDLVLVGQMRPVVSEPRFHDSDRAREDVLYYPSLNTRSSSWASFSRLGGLSIQPFSPCASSSSSSSCIGCPVSSTTLAAGCRCFSAWNSARPWIDRAFYGRVSVEEAAAAAVAPAQPYLDQ